MRIDTFTIFVPVAPDGTVWLLRRSPDKPRHANLITGIGGRVELAQGEGEDLEAAGRREWGEEVSQWADILDSVRLRLVTHDVREDNTIYVLLWYTVKLTEVPTDTSCTEGTLIGCDPGFLPVKSMIPTARNAIPFVLGLDDDDTTVYSGLFEPDHAGLVVRKG